MENPKEVNNNQEINVDWLPSESSRLMHCRQSVWRQDRIFGLLFWTNSLHDPHVLIVLRKPKPPPFSSSSSTAAAVSPPPTDEAPSAVDESPVATTVRGAERASIPAPSSSSTAVEGQRACPPPTDSIVVSIVGRSAKATTIEEFVDYLRYFSAIINSNRKLTPSNSKSFSQLRETEGDSVQWPLIDVYLALASDSYFMHESLTHLTKAVLQTPWQKSCNQCYISSGESLGYSKLIIIIIIISIIIINNSISHILSIGLTLKYHSGIIYYFTWQKLSCIFRPIDKSHK